MQRRLFTKVAVYSAMLGCLSLAACTTTPAPTPEPKVETVTVRTEVAKPCQPANLPSKQGFTDTAAALKAGADAADRYQLLAANNALHFAWEDVLVSALEGCGAKFPATP